jgi:glutamyl-tRNA synthetase
MKITHVVRGSEWMSSTPLHVAMYAAMDWTPPAYAHVPLLVDQNKQKLSKRNFDIDIASFRDKWILPEALINFAALLGWSHQQKNDVMSMGKLQQVFDLKITKGNTVVAFEKLDFLQEQHARQRVLAQGEPFEQMIRDVAVAVLEREGAGKVFTLVGKRALRDVVASMLQSDSLAYRSPAGFAEKCSVFVTPPRRPKLDIDDTSLLRELQVAATALTFIPEEMWNSAVLSQNLAELNAVQDVSDPKAMRKWKGQLYHYLRWALLSGAPGPTIPQTMEILGKAVCQDRMQRALADSTSQAREKDNGATQPTILKAAAAPSSWTGRKSAEAA